MKPSASIRSFLIIASSSLLAISYSHAATLYWDGATPTGAPGGGAGTWDTSATNWDTSLTGNDAAWSGTTDTAFFFGTAGTVTLGTSISVGGLRFDTTGYTISTGANTLSFGTGDNNILLNGNTPTASSGIPVTATITGAVGGTGNVILSFGAIQAWGGGFQNLGGHGVINFNGTSSTGWSGTTTVKQGMTLALSSLNQGLVSTTGITLLGGTRNQQSGTVGGGITITNTTNTEAALDRVSSAAIISNGGNITVTNTANAVTSYSETMGALDLRLGTLNVTQTNLLNSGTQTLTFGSNSLTNVNGGARTNATTSSITFSGASLGANARNSIIITGQADTNANEIIAPWATYGASAGVQTDFAVYNRGANGGVVNTFGIQGAAITASAESAWSAAYAATNNHTLANATGSAANGKLSATRIVNTVKNTSSALNFSGATVLANAITQAGTSFADGDAVVLGAALGGGATAGNTVYYVVGASGTTFSLAATPGGTPLTVTSVSGNITGGISLSSGNDLQTYGILNASAERLAIGGATGAGVLSTPSGGGNLYLTTGNTGNIIINAPITNSVGGGAVTVVRNGSADNAVLTLSGNNSFTGGLVLNTVGNGGSTRLPGTQGFTGGVILNGGLLGDSTTPLTAAALNNNAITVNGLAQIFVANGETLTSSSSITINSTGALDIGASGTMTVNGVVSGTGTLLLNHGNTNSGSTVILANTANTFTGNVISSQYNGGSRPLLVNSFGDGGKVTVGYNSANSATPTSKIFGLNSTATAPLTFNTRQFELIGPALGNIDTLALANNSPQAFTINTDLLVNALGTRTLTLQGTGAGLSTFAGLIANGSLTGLGLTKAEAGTWILSNTANSYNGRTTITAGTLQVSTLANGSSNSSIGASSSAVGNLILNGGTLRYSGGSISTDRNFALTATSTIDASGAAAVNFSQTGIVSPDQTLTADVAVTKVVTGLSSTADLVAGMRVTGAGIAANSTIASIDSSSQITLNNTPTAGAGVSLSFGYTASARTLTLTGTNTGANTIAGVLQNTSAVTLGVLSLTKAGTGTWLLSNANTYTGTTTASGGILKLNHANALPGGTGASGGTSGLTILNAGVVGLTADFSRALGTGATQVQWTGAGGFAAYGGDRTVNLGGNVTPTSIGFTTTSFVSGTNALILSAADADGTLIWSNPISFAGSSRTIQVNNGSAAVDARLNGALSGGTSSGLNKTGLGTLETTNPSNSYTGATSVSAGTLRLGASDVLPNTTNVTIATATLDAATFDDTVGTLDVTAAATINVGSSANLAFAASNAVDWALPTAGSLNITGTFVPGDGSSPGSNPGSLRFGTNNTGLTGGQLSQITASGWTNFGLDAFGYLTATSTGGNTAPNISDIANQSVPSGGNTGAIGFTVGDAETAVGSLTLSVSANSNPTLIPNGNIIFGGSGASRNVTVTPVSGLSGSATITVTVSDGALTAQDTFTLTVTDNYLSWATAGGVTGGVNGDHDNDGVKNLVEYALVNGGERGVLTGNTITFSKRGVPYGSDLTYIIETSETLASLSWTDAVTHGPALLVSNPTISHTFTPSTPVKKFARLKVVQMP